MRQLPFLFALSCFCASADVVMPSGPGAPIGRNSFTIMINEDGTALINGKIVKCPNAPNFNGKATPTCTLPSFVEAGTILLDEGTGKNGAIIYSDYLVFLVSPNGGGGTTGNQVQLISDRDGLPLMPSDVGLPKFPPGPTITIMESSDITTYEATTTFPRGTGIPPATATYNINSDPAPVSTPEPASIALLGTTVLITVAYARRFSTTKV